MLPKVLGYTLKINIILHTNFFAAKLYIIKEAETRVIKTIDSRVRQIWVSRPQMSFQTPNDLLNFFSFIFSSVKRCETTPNSGRSS